jgi:hypothetical protein
MLNPYFSHKATKAQRFLGYFQPLRVSVLCGELLAHKPYQQN